MISKFLSRVSKRAIISNGYILLCVFLVSLSLLLMNYYTIRVLSGVRAYINGESLYAKGQKEASSNLLMYIDTGENVYWEKFEKALSVNLGDKLARESLTARQIPEARNGLLMGENHPEDFDVLIWVFTSFENFSFMKEPIKYWEEADELIVELQDKGHLIRDNIKSNNFDKAEMKRTRLEIYRLSDELTEYGRLFAGSLSNTARQISQLLFIANTILILAIVGGASLFSYRIIRRLSKSEKSLLQKNEDLRNTNNELDKFVYSASHDLRAPITSLKGLIKIAKSEKNPEKLEEYFSLMEMSLIRQDSFIKKIISFSKNKRAGDSLESVNLKTLIDEILTQHEFMENFSSISIRTDIINKQIKVDVMRLEIILSNIISNAVKYTDKTKDEQYISLSATEEEKKLFITIEDNGIGISEEDQMKIFDMFFMTKGNSNGTGIGLYIVRETVEKLGGKIAVESTKGIGTKFIIMIPTNN